MSKLKPEEVNELLNISIPSGSEASFCSSDDDVENGDEEFDLDIELENLENLEEVKKILH